MVDDRACGPMPDNGFQHPDPVSDAALDWFVHLQEAPQDRKLREQFQIWLDSDPRHAAAFAKLEAMWTLPELDIASARLAARLDETPKARVVPARRQVRRTGKWTKRLAALAAVMMVAIGIRSYPALMLRWNADHLTATGAQGEFVLPDGSRLMLNTASAVALDFEGQNRSVTLLQGEAFFDVVPDPARPFRVAGAFGDVEVKGTAFSVRTGAEDTVILERGRVEVSRQGDDAGHATLSPGEKVEVSAAGLSPVTGIDAESALAWRTGWVTFQEKPLADVLADLGRYYEGRILTLDGSIGRVRVSGNYRLADPEGAIRSLAEAAGVKVTRLPGGIIILR
ncbi:FecR family protein [Aquamicrobium terrae]|uniref:Transmembrane sensor n=1 Tax=Aquamicrobium terrae TaxID=1324945 RepID=A0ABV2MZX0_9HYPH